MFRPNGHPKNPFQNPAMLLPRITSLFVPKFSFVRTAVSNFRPKKLAHKKAFKGTFKSRPLSLRGTTVYFGDYGLQVMEGGRLSDKQLDVCRTAIKRTIKSEKESKFTLKVFPSRPVTRKPAETRMGKGKGAVDYFASWVSRGRVVFEVGKCREEVAVKALKTAMGFLPLRSRIIKRDDIRLAPRVLPHFIKEKLDLIERGKRIAALDSA